MDHQQTQLKLKNSSQKRYACACLQNEVHLIASDAFIGDS